MADDEGNGQIGCSTEEEMEHSTEENHEVQIMGLIDGHSESRLGGKI